MEERDDLEEQDDFKSKRIVYTIPAMEDAIIQKDITYKVVDDRELKLDVYYPPDYEGEARLPAVLLVHGDGSPEFLKDAKDCVCYEAWGQSVPVAVPIAGTFTPRATQTSTR